MGILYSRGCMHIPGHKEETHNCEIKSFNPKRIYFPCLAGNGKPVDLQVKEQDHVKVGTLIGIQQGFNVPCFSSVSGTVVGVEKRFNSLVGRPIDHLVIENDNNYEKEPVGKTLDFASATKEEIVEGIKNAGIVGLGGAGFPTYIKYGAEGIHAVLINACECEPYLNTDFVEIKNQVTTFLKGVELLRRAANATKAIVATKKTKKELIDVIKAEIGKYENIELKTVKDVYPAGWERTLIWNVFHKDYKMLPSEVGVIVNNADTAIAVAKALLDGTPLTTRVITVSGDGIAEPSLVEAPIWTPIKDIIEFCGGYTSSETLLISGGPMCGKALMKDEAVTEKQTGGLTVLQYHEVKEETCWHCGACTLHCPASLQPVEIMRAVASKDVKRMQDLQAQSCIECGMCATVCPAKIPVTEQIRKAKLQLRIEAAKQAAPKK